MNKMKKLLLAGITSLLIGSLMIGCGEEGTSSKAEGEKKIRIGYVDAGGGAPMDILAVADQENYLKEELNKVGYDVELIGFTGGGPAVNAAFVAGEIDVASYGDLPTVLGASQGVETTALAGEVFCDDAALMVLNDSDVKSIQDLKGKKVATGEGTYTHRILISMLKENNMTMDDIQFVNMSSTDSVSALQTGSIDAALFTETQTGYLVTEKIARPILSGKDNDDWNGGSAIVGLSSYVENNKDAIKAFCKAILRANEYALNDENYDNLCELLAKSGSTKEGIQYIRPNVIDFNITAGDEFVEAERKILDFLIDNKLTSNDVDINKWVDSSYLEEAKKELNLK